MLHIFLLNEREGERERVWEICLFPKSQIKSKLDVFAEAQRPNEKEHRGPHMPCQ